jgi:hypothetical protein
VIDAYPIVEVRDYRTPAGRESYVVIDPAAGQNRFSLIGDAFGQRSAARLEVELSFSQSFRPIADGATWENVFAAYAKDPVEGPDDGVEPNPFKVSGTLGMSLRRYREGAEYQELPMAPYGDDFSQEFFFRSDTRIVRNTGDREEVAAHWNIHPGMRPIEWVISPELAALDDTPRFADYDLIETITAGIEGWNQAFGFPVFKARVARADEDFWQDDKNYLIFDPSPEAGFAFADWRTNPNTGETRGASVYFGSVWLDPEDFEDDDPDDVAAPSARPVVRRIEWDGVSSPPLCILPPRAHITRHPGDAQRTAKDKFERALASTILHEVGHTLGLRHNFKGSLVPPGASVMDYSTVDDAIATGATPGAYDVAAVRYLYALTPDAPTQPFCTDELIGIDPDCQQFDAGANPLDDFHRAEYAAVVAAFTSGRDLPVDVLDNFAAGLVAYVQTGDAARAAKAWKYAIAGIAAPLSTSRRKPAYAAGANTVMTWLLGLVAPQHEPSIEPKLVEQAGLIARNVDTVRPAPMRRAMVDLLKKLQTAAGFQALLSLRADLDAQLKAGTLSAAEALVVQDLIARVDRAISPYFD